MGELRDWHGWRRECFTIRTTRIQMIRLSRSQTCRNPDHFYVSRVSHLYVRHLYVSPLYVNHLYVSPLYMRDFECVSFVCESFICESFVCESFVHERFCMWVICMWVMCMWKICTQVICIQIMRITACLTTRECGVWMCVCWRRERHTYVVYGCVYVCVYVCVTTNIRMTSIIDVPLRM